VCEPKVSQLFQSNPTTLKRKAENGHNKITNRGNTRKILKNTEIAKNARFQGAIVMDPNAYLRTVLFGTKKW